MGKTFKKYNESTKKWENFYVPDATIVQQMEDGTDIIDTNVVVTNINYTDEEEKTTLNDTLSMISDDISRLQRNVSWLAEHGGGGGGGQGGGGFSDYGVVITSPTDITSEGNVYVDATALTVTFMVTGGSQSDTCTYRYRYDTELSQEVNINFGEEIAIQLDLTINNKKDHTLQIMATVFGQQLTPVSIHIYRSSLSIWFDTGATTHYENEILSIAQDDNLGIVPLVMSNGLIGSVTTLSVLRGSDVVKTIELPENTTTEDQKLPNGILPGISFWDIVKNPIVNEQYVIYIDAKARVGNVETSASRLQVRVRVINPNELTISFGINGQAQSPEPIDVEIGSTMIYNFKCYAPIGIDNIYYSAKIVKNGVATRLIGAYYDESLKEEGSTYINNPYAKVETTIFSQYTVSESEYNVGDEAVLYVKVWGAKSNRVEEASQVIRIVQTTSEIFPRQYPNRVGYLHGTMLASWNRKNVTDTSRNVWKSTVNDYVFISGNFGSGPQTVTCDMTVINGNNDSGLISSTAPRYLRLQNRAYAAVNLHDYYEEVTIMTNSRNNNGFTISVTFTADDAANTNKTVLLWGANDTSTNSLVSGVRIDADKVYWKASSSDKLMSCNISPGTKHTVDFSFDGSLNLAKIYINGILNLVAPINRETMLQFPENIFIGANYTNGEVRDYCDVNVYELSIYTQTLNDVQIIVNGKNARLNGSEDDPAVKSDYAVWKGKNFFSGPNASTLFFNTNSSSYRSEYSLENITQIQTNSNIPTLRLYFSDNSGFTKKYFLGQHSTAETGRTFPSTLSYFDPETRYMLEEMRFKVSLQGTSTLTYRIKNLEIITDETTEVDGEVVPVLFQPKKTWFPENQFTLKADVVDSSHANNAVIGEWINNSGIFGPNPAMERFNPETRPKEVDPSGNERTHKIDGGTDYIDYDENVTIKHTLEGFPVLLFIHFDGSGDYTFVGIYSFNLGRYSYYNMGLKFLESFSRGDSANSSTPRKITYYKEKNTLGNISLNDVKSFEFGNYANSTVWAYPTWSQFDASIVSIMGDYKYPSIQDPSSDLSFNGLCRLFESVAKAQLSLTDKFNGIYPYRVIKVNDNYEYIQDGDIPIAQSRQYQPVLEKIDRNNAVAYFIIANAFGMTDSLAKNLTLRTWDNGNKWWPCFYDMDTALGLSNTGTEDIPVYVAIDKVTNDPVNGATFEYHNSLNGLGYSGYMSKLWGVFRDPYFVYDEYGSYDQPNDYIRAWVEVRSEGGPLSTSEKFTTMMAERVETCGEIVYNCDYYGKYIETDDFGDGSQATESSTVFLHGTRVEYVRKWLRNHLYFLDGVFDPKSYSSSIQGTYEDSPYLGSVYFSVNAQYPETQPTISFRVKAVTPTFIRLIGGNTGTGSKFYINSSTEEQIVTISNSTSTNTAIIVHGSTLLSQFNGLNGAFRGIGSGAGQSSMRALETFDVKNSKGIQQDGVGRSFLNVIKYKGDSPLEDVDLSYTEAPDTTCELYLDDLTKVLRINISHSDVTTLVLPKSSLDYLNVEHSKIGSLTLENQNKLSAISLDGCDRITQFSVKNCDNIQNISVSDKVSLLTSDIENNEKVSAVTFNNCESLNTVNISGNKNLETVSLSECSKLSTVYIGNNPSLKHIYIRCDGRSMGNVSIRIYNCPLLETLDIGNIIGEKVIDIDTASVSNIKSVNLSRFYGLSGIRYDDGEVETYQDGNVVIDFSPMSSLENVSLANIDSVKYVRFKNSQEDGPVSITQSSFENCNGLRRVFGYISLDGSSIFVRKPYFKLNEDDMKNDGHYDYTAWHDSDIIEFFTGEYDTNIEIGTENMSSMFAYTLCSLGDVYYVFGKINDDVTSISSMFRGCENIRVAGMIDYETEEVIQEGFSKYCTNVDEISFLFDGCSEFHGRISAQDMHTLSKRTTNFDSVFPDGLWYDNSEGLFASGNSIERIANFNPNFSESTHESIEERYTSRAISASTLLDGMDEIVTFENALNGGQILFCEEGSIEDLSSVRCCELLKGKTKLKTIRNSFNRIIIGNGDVAKGLICDPDDPDMQENYSSGLTEISNSFTFEQEGGIRNAVLIGNKMFESCKKSIRNISGSFGGNILKLMDPNDSDVCDNGTKFPYRVFSGLTYLTDASNFFEHFSISPLRGFDPDDEGGEPIDRVLVYDQTITLPTFVENGETHSMFETNGNLTRVNSLFKNMYFGKYVLTPYGFKDNRIEYANEIFSEYTFLNNYEDPFIEWESKKARKIGQIPYGLFYQELGSQINPTIKTLEYAFEGTNGTELSVYSIDTSSNDIMDYLEMSDSGKWVWNKYLHDGTGAFERKINELIADNPSIAADTEHYDLTIPSEIAGEYDEVDINRILARYIGYAVGTSEYIDSIKANIFGKRNYFCPPDILRYCENGNLTKVDGIFKNRESGIADGNNTTSARVYGYHGRIPSFIFEPISAAESINAVFFGLKLIMPEEWPTTTGRGAMYPQIFKKLTGIKYLQSIFEDSRIWGKTYVSSMFGVEQGSRLLSLSRMWALTDWMGKQEEGEDCRSVLEGNTFTNCSILSDVSGMFEGRGPQSLPGSSLFNDAHATIMYCGSFLRNGQTNSGTLVPFWDTSIFTRPVTSFSECYKGLESSFPDDYANPDARPFFM